MQSPTPGLALRAATPWGERGALRGAPPGAFCAEAGRSKENPFAALAYALPTRNRAAFSRQRLSGAICAASEGSPHANPAPPLGFSSIALRKPSGSGRLSPRGSLPPELSLEKATRPRQRAGRSPAAAGVRGRRDKGHGIPRLSEEGPAASSTDTA